MSQQPTSGHDSTAPGGTGVPPDVRSPATGATPAAGSGASGGASTGEFGSAPGVTGPGSGGGVPGGAHASGGVPAGGGRGGSTSSVGGLGGPGGARPGGTVGGPGTPAGGAPSGGAPGTPASSGFGAPGTSKFGAAAGGGFGAPASGGPGAPGSGGFGAPGAAGPGGTGTAGGAAVPGAPGRGGATAAGGDGEAARVALNRLRAEVGKVIVGQDPAVTGLVIALLCRGHVLLEGVPGVAKTLMVRALSAALALETKRVQFTPDLMPGDVTGSLIYDARTAEFSFRAGPVFTNLLLADEINRTPPKTQASLLEAMEERQVTIDGEPRMLPDPFVVIATQNPIEYEGTYPLPEAQLDRFLLKLTVPLPSRDEEFRVLNNHHRGFDPRDLRAAGVNRVADAADLAAGRAAVRGVQAAAEVLAYVVDLCRATRQSPSLSLGASPRGAVALLSTAKAWAWLSGRDYVTPDDVKALARPTLRHRVAVRPEAELEGVTADGVLDRVLAAVPAPR